MAQRKLLPDDIAERVEQGMSAVDLAEHYGWNRSTLWTVLRRENPELGRKVAENGNRSRSVKASANAQRVNRKRALNRRDRSTEPFMDLSKEKLITKVTQAVRHLQRQRLGPCYPWKDGYYWMGKCLDADALMAEATKRGLD